MDNTFNFNRATERIKTAWTFFQTDMVNYGLTILVGSLVSSITCGITSGPISLGLLTSARKLRNSEKVEINDAFSQMSNFLPPFLLSLVVGLVYMVVLGIFYGLTVLVAMITKGCGLCFMYPVLIAVIIVVGGLVQIIFTIGMNLIHSENLDFQNSLKKTLEFLKTNNKLSMEYYVSLLLCGLAAIVPFIGGIVAVGLMMLVSTIFYDEIKEAQMI